MQKAAQLKEVSQMMIQGSGIDNLDRIFDAQKEAFTKHPMPGAAERIHHLKCLKKALLENKDNIASAINADFSSRSKDETSFAEIFSCIEGINFTTRRIKRWMRPSWRMPGLIFLPAWAKVYYQPKGVVGIIVPWNYPLYLTIGPLTGVLAAGNSAVIKMSRFSQNLAELLKNIFNEIFEETQVALFTGEEASGSAFTNKPWDHLVFTGSTSAGRQVMRAASEHLTPVTLELGGKSPAIIGHDVPMIDAAKRIAWGKLLNAGQTCVAPDHVLCPKHRVPEFVDAFKTRVTSMYKTLKTNSDYTAIENEQQYRHVQDILEDARAKNAKLIEINPAHEDFSGTRKIPVYLLLDVTEDMKALKEEIFGPVLPVIPYDTLEDAVRYVNARPRPLAMYYFDYNRKNAEYIIRNTHAGGMVINDTIIHVGQNSLPFGGIGESGMGEYHGREGFLTFSKAKGVLFKPRFNTGKLIYPPYGKMIQRIIKAMFIR